MDREKRLIELQKILEYCTKKKVFTLGERICINQERGQLMDDEKEIKEPFNYSKSLQNKIDFTLTKII